MNELRGKIADILDSMDAIIEATGHDYRRQRDARTDRILALIAEAMLSLTKPTTYAEEIAAMSPETGGWRRQAMERDLAAAGITPGDAREGGDEAD